MRTHKKVVREYDEYDEFFCDWCNANIPEPVGYETRDFELEFSKGESYPEDSYREGWKVEDLCDKCIDKLREVIEELGITVREIK